ncbi:MAG: tetratricopeptide repeat protein [Spirochaetales bacterium]|nr:tetratricopeptide repeat protein [Spirochaetales bacterium]
MSRRRFPVFVLSLSAVVAVLSSCVGDPPARPGTSLGASSEASRVMAERSEMESLIALGSPSSLEKAVELAEKSTGLPAGDALAYGWISYEMARLVYPELAGTLPPSSISPPDSPLVRAFIDARNGKPGSPGGDAGPLLELFPALSIFRLKTAAAAGTTLAAMERFGRFGLPSAAGDVARGIALERSGDMSGALSAYTRAESAAADCYPATLGRARMLVETGQGDAALSVLKGLSSPIAGSAAYRRIEAQALYAAGRWDEAMPLVTAVLLDDPLDSRFALMRAHLLIERGEFKQAASLLDAYASINPTDRLYILLRARSAMESTKDRAAAAAALRTGLARYPDDAEMVLYAAEVFWKGDAGEKAEAVAFANKALAADPTSTRALRILLAAELASGTYVSAAARADSILAIGGDFDDYESLYKAYRGAGRMDDAAVLARTWRTREPSSEQAAIAWATALVEGSAKEAAGKLIAELLKGPGSSAYRSSLFWLQSRLQAGDDAALSSLRSALVENGMNVDALAAMSDIYVRKADYQRARFYLKQALAIAPERPDIVERREVLVQLGVAIP